MNYAIAQHDRMIATMLLPCKVVAIDLEGAMVRVKAGDWVSAWVRWHGLAAGKARHWRVPSLHEQGALLSPSGVPAIGTFIPGLYGIAGTQPDNRDHVEVWRFDDGGSLIYDWQSSTYTIDLPAGAATIKVGASVIKATPEQVHVAAPQIAMVGAVEIEGSLHVTSNITSDASIIDTSGNSNNHSH